MDLRERRISILHRVESGELTLEDGNRLLTELEERVLDEITETRPPAGALRVAAPAPFKENSAPLTNLVPMTNQEPTLTGAAGSLPEKDPALAGIASQLHPEILERIQPVEMDQEARHLPGWRGLWTPPFLLGLFLTLVSINWMVLGLASAGLGWGFWLSFFPLALGILLMWAGWEMRKARWLHLRIRQRPGQRPAVIAISLPLPIGFTRWVVQHFGKFSPQVNGQDVGDFLDEFDQAIATDGPMHVYVDNEDGEQVEIWIEGPLKKIKIKTKQAGQ
jgi:hypothetical protein